MRRHLLALSPALLVAATLLAGCKDSNAPDGVGAPVDIQPSAGDRQTGAAGLTMPAPIAAKVTDARGRGVPNIEVSFQVMPGSGTVNPTVARTNGAGIATTSWTLPTFEMASAQVRAVFVDTLTGALVDSATFTAKVVGGPPVFMQPMPAPDRAAVGLAVPLSVMLRDQYYNRSPGATVKWAVTAGSGTLSAPTTVSDSTGVATVALTLGAVTGNNSITATVGSMTTTLSVLGVKSGEPATIVAAGYQSIAQVNSTFPLSVSVRDGFDQPVAGATVTWTDEAGNGTLSAPTSVTSATGQATIQYTLGSHSGQYKVKAQAGTVSTEFVIESREAVQRFTTLPGGGYGIDRSASGQFAVVLFGAASLTTFAESTPTVQQTIPLGGTPVVVAIDAAGKYAYVSNMGGWVDVVDLAAFATVSRVVVPGAHSLTMGPGGTRVYVASYLGSVYAINTSTLDVAGKVDVPNGPWGMAFKSTAADSLMYVTSRDGGTVTEVDTKAMTVKRTFSVGGRTHGLVISPDGGTLYAADNSIGRVIAISTSTGQITGTASVAGAFGIAISPDGSALFVTTDDPREVVIDASTMFITRAYDSGVDARQVVASPDGTIGYAANEGGWIDLIRR